jgi:hypothetical protein
MNEQFIDQISKAARNSAACLDDLRGAIGKGSPLEALVIEDYLKQASDLSQKLDRLRETLVAQNQSRIT